MTEAEIRKQALYDLWKGGLHNLALQAFGYYMITQHPDEWETFRSFYDEEQAKVRDAAWSRYNE